MIDINIKIIKRHQFIQHVVSIEAPDSSPLSPLFRQEMLAEAGEKLREDLGRLVNSLKLGAEVVRTWGP